MITSVPETLSASAVGVEVSADALSVFLSDGRSVAVPIGWYPRLEHGQPEERNQWRLIGGGQGISWPLLDEDISVEGLLAGRASNESQKSLSRWLKSRAVGIDQ